MTLFLQRERERDAGRSQGEDAVRRRSLLLTAGLLLMAQFLLQGVTEPPHHSEQRPLQHSNKNGRSRGLD